MVSAEAWLNRQANSDSSCHQGCGRYRIDKLDAPCSGVLPLLAKYLQPLWGWRLAPMIMWTVSLPLGLSLRGCYQTVLPWAKVNAWRKLVLSELYQTDHLLNHGLVIDRLPRVIREKLAGGMGNQSLLLDKTYWNPFAKWVKVSVPTSLITGKVVTIYYWWMQ